MCRFIAYIGNPLILDEVLFKPPNSLINQSIHAQEMSEPLNGDGFGLGWYAQDIDFYPALFRSIQPAWNDLNLRNLAPKLRSNCFFAHVRSASIGDISLANCHPFHYEQLLFMHNGHIGNFAMIKRPLRDQLNNNIYNWIKGETDSEHFFALFLNNFESDKSHFDADVVADLMIKTIQDVENIKKKHKCSKLTRINAVITNGKSMVAVRYISNPKKKAASLYYAAGSHYEYHDRACHITPSSHNRNGAILIVSERLTSYNAEWNEIPVNHMLLVFDDLSTSTLQIKA